ncbi:enoyl-CoA hydratase/isomerase family protein [Pseudonocardia kunmingensis]|uniref:Enoyl-CoA hydratase n=1 Tax=Pseudonocardia kunmingensis TaxID=630975 RepID=A0A543DPW3_9PSEU|nr:enoyl-CoA hydratase/isomerase family protein [Pseudonocardia kunmingensis]TQM11382.1 enoyl-CoA hydratase [Pseudonocardia kunmingensis]
MGVRVDDRGAATVVTMGWTAKRNALGPDEAEALAQAVREAGERPGSVVVLTGEGAFCAGGDLPTIVEVTRTMSADEIRETVYGRFQAVVRALRDCPVPTIAAVDGPAVGLGLDLALACDTRFVGPGGWVQQGWARAGLVAGTGGVALLHRIRPGLLWSLLASQDRLGPGECVRLGLADPADGPALDAALARAEALARVPRDVLGHYAALDRSASWPVPEQFEFAASIQGGLIGSERFRAFADRMLARS